MARTPYNATRARRLLDEWVARAAEKAPEEAAITLANAMAYLKAKRMTTNRATFYKYKLHEVLAEGVARQAAGSGAHAAVVEREAYARQMKDLRTRIAALEEGNRRQLGVIATMTFNARRLGVSDAELNRAMPVPDRTKSRSGTGRGTSGS